MIIWYNVIWHIGVKLQLMWGKVPSPKMYLKQYKVYQIAQVFIWRAQTMKVVCDKKKVIEDNELSSTIC